MRAGKLDRLIVIERGTIAPDDYGTPVETWTLIATMRAQLLQHAVDDRLGERGATTDATITFRIRYLAGLTLADRVTYEGAAFAIRQIKESGRRVGLDVRVERIGP